MQAGYLPNVQQKPAVRSPRANPLSYPGQRPSEPVLVTRTGELPITPSGTRPIGKWGVTDGARHTVDAELSHAGQPLVDFRVPIVVAGSLASPAQLRHEGALQGFPAWMPILPARVTGVSVSHAPFISMLGYVPATFRFHPEAVADHVHVMLVDHHQLMCLDQARARYRRVLLSSRDGVNIEVGNRTIASAYAYVAKGGHLLSNAFDAQGSGASPLLSQPEILRRLASASPRLRELLGPTPEGAVERARRADTRWLGAVTNAIKAAGLVGGAREADAMECRKDRRPLYVSELEGVLPESA